MVFWLQGGFDNRGWEHASLVAPPGCDRGGVRTARSALNPLMLGDERRRAWVVVADDWCC
jgi:hypothetical protein